MSRKPVTARHKSDTTAKALAAHAESLGVSVETLGGTIDAALWLGHVVRLVDWKSTHGALTPSQAKLVAKGCPVAFIATPAQLELLVAGMRREAMR